MPGPEPRAGAGDIAGRPPGDAQPAAAGDDSDPGHLAAEFRRDISGHELRRLYDRRVEGICKRAGELIADRQAVDDKGHLVMGPPGMDRAVGVLREAGKGHQRRLQSAAADRRRQLFDTCHADLIACAGGSRVDQRRIVGSDDDRRGLRRQVECDPQVDRNAGPQVHFADLRGEAAEFDAQHVAIERDIDDLEGAIYSGGGAPLQAGEGLCQNDVDRGQRSPLYVGHRAAQQGGRLCDGRQRGKEEEEDGQQGSGQARATWTRSLDAARMPIVISWSFLPRTRTLSAAGSRCSTSIGLPGLRWCPSTNRRNALS